MLTFNSLISLLKIIENEKFYQLQIVTLEPHQNILHILKLLKIKFRVCYLSLKRKIEENNKVNVMINDAKYNVLDFYRNISFVLIGGEVVPGLLHFVFLPQKDEIIMYLEKYHGIDNGKLIEEKSNSLDLKKKNSEKNLLSEEDKALNSKDINLLVKKYFKFKTLAQFNSEIKGNKGKLIPSLNFLESVVVLSLYHYKKFTDIVKNVQKIKSDENNSFKILLVLNKLVKYRFVIKRGTSYNLRISTECVYEICKKIGYDIKRNIEL